MTTSDSSHCVPQLWLMQVNTVFSEWIFRCVSITRQVDRRRVCAYVNLDQYINHKWLCRAIPGRLRGLYLIGPERWGLHLVSWGWPLRDVVFRATPTPSAQCILLVQQIRGYNAEIDADMGLILQIVTFSPPDSNTPI